MYLGTRQSLSHENRYCLVFDSNGRSKMPGPQRSCSCLKTSMSSLLIRDMRAASTSGGRGSEFVALVALCWRMTDIGVVLAAKMLAAGRSYM